MKTITALFALLLSGLVYRMCWPPATSAPPAKPTVAAPAVESSGPMFPENPARESAGMSTRAGQGATYSVPTVSISMIYSGEKAAWVKTAASAFIKRYPAYQVSLTESSSLAAARDILDGAAYPDVWSPASSMVISWFMSEWPRRNQVELDKADEPIALLPLITSGDDAPVEILRSPITFIAWESSLHDSNISRKGWPTVSASINKLFEVSTERPMRLGYTNPSLSSSGLQAFYLLALLFYGDRLNTLTMEQVQDSELREYLRQWEARVMDFPESTTTLTANMFRFGPSRYQVVATYENLALQRKIQSWKVPGPFGKLLIGYPKVTMWADHPAIMLRARDGDRNAQSKLAVARLWIKFLRSREMQETAMDYGFRPVTIPFNINDPHSILYRVPSDKDLRIVEPPSAEVIRSLLDLWHFFQTGQTSLKVRSQGRLEF